VTEDEIDAPCKSGPNRFSIQGGAACTLTVAAGGTGLRSLHLTSNQAIKVEARVARKDYTMDDEPDVNKEFSVAIDEQGSAVALQCLLPAQLQQPCIVTLGSGE
jgi:hypothetical protein